MRVDDLHQAGHGLANGLLVACVQVAAEREVLVECFGEVVLPQCPDRFGKVVDHESVVTGEQVRPHLGDFPTRQVEVQAVDEGHVVANDVRHRRKQVSRLNHHVDRLIGVAEHRNTGVAGIGFLASLKCARFAVRLERRDDFLGHFLQIGHFVEGDHVPDRNHAFVLARACGRTCWQRSSGRSAVPRTAKVPGRRSSCRCRAGRVRPG